MLELLFAFRPNQPSLSLSELVQATGLPHATARRLALELVAAGALDRDSGGRFTVGLRLWQLGTLAPHTESLRVIARPFMEDLYTALQQHVQLAVLEGNEAVIVDRMSAPDALGIISRVGGRLPLHCSGVGKVLLSHAGPELTERILGGKLRRFTSATVIDPETLRTDLASCRHSATAIIRRELTTEADSVATRIVDSTGRVVAALSVVVRSGSVELNAAIPSVVASGLGISRALGWKPGVAVLDG